MALYSGVTGKITTKIGTGTAAELLHMTNWSVDLSKEMIEAISFGEDYKEKVPGVKDWSASADGSTDFATTSGQKALVDAFEGGTKIEAAFYLDTTTFMTGDCYIESLSISHAADGKSEVSIKLAGSGGIDLTVPTA